MQQHIRDHHIMWQIYDTEYFTTCATLLHNFVLETVFYDHIIY